MKKVILIGLFLGTFMSLQAQEWLTDFEEAKNIASQNNHNIVLVFQGSDWCAPCIKLEKEILSSDEFVSYSNAHFVMLKADFPRKKKNKLDKEQQEKNNKLAEIYNTKGFFPLVVVLNNEGEVLGKSGYKNIKPSAYISLLASF